jgi:hypothetical protein
MNEEITVDELRARAEQIGLKLSDSDIERLLQGVNRSQKQVVELRSLLSDEVEPAAIYRATAATREDAR